MWEYTLGSGALRAFIIRWISACYILFLCFSKQRTSRLDRYSESKCIGLHSIVQVFSKIFLHLFKMCDLERKYKVYICTSVNIFLGYYLCLMAYTINDEGYMGVAEFAEQYTATRKNPTGKKGVSRNTVYNLIKREKDQPGATIIDVFEIGGNTFVRWKDGANVINRE